MQGDYVGLGLDDTAADDYTRSDTADPSALPNVVEDGITKRACLSCRKLKIKCTTNHSGSCTRCLRLNKACVRTAAKQAGRPKGSQNRIRPANNAANAEVVSRGPMDNTAARDTDMSYSMAMDDILQVEPQSISRLVPNTPNLAEQSVPSVLPGEHISTVPTSWESPSYRTGAYSGGPSHPPQYSRPMEGQSYLQPHESNTQTISLPTFMSPRAGQTTTQSVSNPLGLLAETSAAESATTAAKSSNAAMPSLQSTKETTICRFPPNSNTLMDAILSQNHDARLGSLGLNKETVKRRLDLITSSGPIDLPVVSASRKIVPTYRDDQIAEDPVEMGLLSDVEVYQFFHTFFEHLHPLIAILDPHLHTIKFVQSRSKFLFTVILANGADYTPASLETAKRLKKHAERLSKSVIRSGFQSVEIVQAMLLWLPWLYSDDEHGLWRRTVSAVNLAMELGLDCPVSEDAINEPLGVLILGDVAGVNMNDRPLLSRLVRNRERLWLRCFLWESALAVALGKTSSFAHNRITCDSEWYKHPLAIEHDYETCALAQLRLQLIPLSEDFKHRNNSSTCITSADQIGTRVTSVFTPLLDQWIRPHPEDSTSFRIRKAYLGLMYRHGRLWLLSYGLHAKTSSSEQARIMMEECLASALDSVSHAISEIRAYRAFWYMPNPVAPMLAYAALLTLRLIDQILDASDLNSRLMVVGLVADMADLMEQVGTYPPQRYAQAALYGQRLKNILHGVLARLLHRYAESAATGSSQPMHFEQMPPADLDLNDIFDTNYWNVFSTGDAMATGQLENEEISSLFRTFLSGDMLPIALSRPPSPL